MARREVRYSIKARDESKRATQSASNNLDKVNKSARSLSKVFKAGLGIAGAAVSFRALTKAVGSSVEAFREQEEAEAQLRGALRATGENAEQVGRKIGTLAGELQKVTTFGDEATIKATGLLQSLADLDSQGLQRVIPAMQDFATGMGIDLNNAAQLIGKTLSSSTNALVRYGIEIDASASKSEKLNQLTEELNSKFGGLSEEMAGTASGSLRQLNNALGDLAEQVGEGVLNFFSGAIQGATRFAEALTGAIEKARTLREALGGGGAGGSSASARKDALEEQRQTLLSTIAAQEALKDAAETTNRVRFNPETLNNAKRELELVDERIAAMNEEMTYAQLRANLEAKLEKGAIARAEYEQQIAEAAKEEAARRQAAIDARVEAEEKYRDAVLDIQRDVSLGLENQEGALQRQQDAAAQFYHALADAGYTENLRNANGELQIGAELMRQMREELERLNALSENGYGVKPYQGGSAGGFGQGGGQGGAPHGGSKGFLERLETGFAKAEGKVKQLTDGMKEGFAAVKQTLGPILGSFSSLSTVFSMINQILNPIQTILEGVFSVLAPIMEQLLAPLVGILRVVGQVIGNLLAPALMVLRPIVEMISSLFIFLYNEIIRPLNNAIVTAMVWVVNAVIDVLKMLTAPIESTLGFIYNSILLPVLNTIITAVTWMANTAVGLFNGIMQPIASVVEAIYSNILQPSSEAIVSGFEAMMNFIIDALNLALDPIRELFSRLYNDVIRPISNTILGAMAGMFNGIIKIIRKALKQVNKIPGVNINRPNKIDEDDWRLGRRDFSGVSVDRISTSGGLADIGDIAGALELARISGNNDLSEIDFSDALGISRIDSNFGQLDRISMEDLVNAGFGDFNASGNTDVWGFGGSSGGDSSSGGASYSKGRKLTVNVEVNTEVVAGDAGIRDLALMIRREIRQAEALGI